MYDLRGKGTEDVCLAKNDVRPRHAGENGYASEYHQRGKVPPCHIFALNALVSWPGH